MAAPPVLTFDTDFDPQTGTAVPVAPGVVRVTAPNGGPYTFTGTNSFLVGEAALLVVDPGPDDAAHLAALLRAVAGRKVEAIVLTHTHRDHSDLVPKLRTAVGAPVWFGGRHRLSRPARPFEINAVKGESDWALVPDRVLVEGDEVGARGARLRVIATPGHCSNHLAFGLGGTDVLLSGDHIMGWNSTLVSVPDGSMADYLDSLRKVIALPYRGYLPAHGGGIVDGPAYATALLAHREMRNAQVVAAVNGGAKTIRALRKAIYPTLAVLLYAAAEMTLKAHVEFLAERGEIAAVPGKLGMRLGPRGS